MDEKERILDNGQTPEPSGKEPAPKKKASRRRKHGLISLLVTVFVVVAIVIVNVIAVTLNQKFSGLTADLTGLKSFQLTEQSKKLAESVSKKTQISFLSDKNTYVQMDAYCKQTSIIAEELARCSDGMIEVQYVDLVRNPTFAEGYSDSNLSTTDVIVSCEDKKKVLTTSDLFNFESFSEDYRYIASSNAEQEIDNAIAAVNNEQVTNAVIIKDYCSEDYSYLKTTLSSNGYSVSEVSLVNGELPVDTDLVIIYAPTRDYSEEAVQKLNTFMKNDGTYGKTLLYAADSMDAQTPHLDAFLAQYDLELAHAIVFETDTTQLDSRSQNYYDGILCQYYSDLYTDNITDKSLPVITGFSRSVYRLEGKAQPLLSLSERSGECPYDVDDEKWNMEEAITGKECVLAQGTIGNDKTHSTVVLSGTYLPFTQTYYGSAYANQTYLSTMLATLTGRDTSQITVAKKVITEFDINIDRSTALTLGFIVYGFVPLLIFGAGLTVYLMRRHK